VSLVESGVTLCSQRPGIRREVSEKPARIFQNPFPQKKNGGPEAAVVEDQN
jgi:hypothetical protein